MEDLPDKLRRNVVVLAAAIVAITLFHLSFKPTGTLLGFAEVGNVTPLKVWLALTAVLIYVFLRYWFDEKTDKERALLAEEFDNRRYAAISDHLRRAIERYLEHDRQPSCIADFATLAEQQLSSYPDLRARHARVTVSVDLRRDGFSPWRGYVRVGFDLHWASGGVQPRKFGSPYRFRIAPLRVASIVLRCALGTATYSKSAVDTLVPIGLATVAFAMCIFQLVMAGVKP